jgi:hypothetical protein
MYDDSITLPTEAQRLKYTTAKYGSPGSNVEYIQYKNYVNGYLEINFLL